jgi:hypothetical protein
MNRFRMSAAVAAMMGAALGLGATPGVAAPLGASGDLIRKSAKAVDQTEQARVVCGPFRCWYARPHWGHHHYRPYYHRPHWGYHRPYWRRPVHYW